MGTKESKHTQKYRPTITTARQSVSKLPNQFVAFTSFRRHICCFLSTALFRSSTLCSEMDRSARRTTDSKAKSFPCPNSGSGCSSLVLPENLENHAKICTASTLVQNGCNRSDICSIRRRQLCHNSVSESSRLWDAPSTPDHEPPGSMFVPYGSMSALRMLVSSANRNRAPEI
jgi:hypothetical protein